MKKPTKAILTGAAIGAVLAGGAVGVPYLLDAMGLQDDESQLSMMAVYGPDADALKGPFVDPFSGGK